MRILWLSNTISGRYGYSVVTSPVTEALQRAGHQMIVFGMQSIHPPFRDKNGIVHVGTRFDAFGSDILGNYIKAYKINLLVTMFDVWLDQAQYIPPTVRQLGIPWICHATINTAPLSPFLARALMQANFIVAPSKWGEKVVREAKLGKTYYIPHAVDTSVYKPLPEEVKQETKKALRIEDKEFIVLSVMRNRTGKNFPDLMHAWKCLLETHAELKQKGVLLLLMDPLEPGGIRADLLRDRVGVTDTVKFLWFKPTEDLSSTELTYEGDPSGILHNANCNFSQEEMAKLYNVASCHVISSRNESFSLPTLEAMACGVPVIFPNHTTGPELVDEPKAGLLVKILRSETTQLISDEWISDPFDLADCMEKIYLSEKLSKQYSENGVKFAQSLSWEKVLPKWVSFVDAVEYLG